MRLLHDVLTTVVRPGLLMLPLKMRSPEAEALLLTIGLQESRFLHRKQIAGPARGFYQFESGGGLRGVMRHDASKDHAHRILDELCVPYNDAFDALVYNDALATSFARLLLYTDPRRLPTLGSMSDFSWQYYIRTWRPGRPHRETWDSFRANSVDAVRATLVGG